MEFCSLIIHWERHRRQMGYWRLCILLTYDIKKAKHLHTKDDNASKTTKRDEHKFSVTASQWHNWPKFLSHFQILYWIWVWIFVYTHDRVAGISKERKMQGKFESVWLYYSTIIWKLFKVEKNCKNLQKTNLVELQSINHPDSDLSFVFASFATRY